MKCGYCGINELDSGSFGGKCSICWNKEKLSINRGVILWQKCPVCDGTGLVSRPPHIVGDITSWVDSGAGPYSCKRCYGLGTILVPLASDMKDELPILWPEGGIR